MYYKLFASSFSRLLLHLILATNSHKLYRLVPKSWHLTSRHNLLSPCPHCLRSRKTVVLPALGGSTSPSIFGFNWLLGHNSSALLCQLVHCWALHKNTILEWASLTFHYFMSESFIFIRAPFFAQSRGFTFHSTFFSGRSHGFNRKHINVSTGVSMRLTRGNS